MGALKSTLSWEANPGLHPDEAPVDRKTLRIPETQSHVLTLTCIFDLFVARFALALSDLHRPLPFLSAVDARWLLTGCVIHAYPAHFRKWLVLTSGHRLRERGEILYGARAGFVEDPDGEKSDAGSDVLKGQVETFSRQPVHHSRLCVDVHFIFAGDLIRSYGGHLLKLALAEGSAHICIRFRRIEVEGFLAY